MKPTITYCEAATNGLIKRPYYAVSNFAFFFSAIYLFLRKEKLAKQFGVLAVLVGCASFLYDASFSYIFQIIDLSMMLVFINFLIIQNIKLKSRNMYIGKTILLVFAVALIILLKGISGDVIFGFFVVFYIGQTLQRFGLKSSVMSKWGLGFLLFLSGFFFWTLDYLKVYCVSFGLLNGRSFFHYFTAISIVLLSEFYVENLK